jgi:hypothetical protein
MLLDRKVYFGTYRDSTLIDIASEHDVSQLNALQLHHSLNAVYFADETSAEYVEGLWRAQRAGAVPPRSEFRVYETPSGPVYHGFEPQINFRLDLSFVKCNPVREADYKLARRSPESLGEKSRPRAGLDDDQGGRH